MHVHLSDHLTSKEAATPGKVEQTCGGTRGTHTVAGSRVLIPALQDASVGPSADCCRSLGSHSRPTPQSTSARSARHAGLRPTRHGAGSLYLSQRCAPGGKKGADEIPPAWAVHPPHLPGLFPFLSMAFPRRERWGWGRVPDDSGDRSLFGHLCLGFGGLSPQCRCLWKAITQGGASHQRPQGVLPGSGGENAARRGLGLARANDSGSHLGRTAGLALPGRWWASATGPPRQRHGLVGPRPRASFSDQCPTAIPTRGGPSTVGYVWGRPLTGTPQPQAPRRVSARGPTLLSPPWGS